MTNSKYENFKKEVSDNYPIRKNLDLSSLKIDFANDDEDFDKLEIDGRSFVLSSNAFNTLVKTLGINNTFMSKFTDIFGIKSKNKLVEIIKSKMSTSNKKVSIYFNPKTFRITSITESDKPFISPNQYFEMVESVINDNNLDLTDMTMDSNGNVSISTLNSGWGFDINGLKDESFTTGVNITTGPGSVTGVNPHILRLVCTNGMTAPDVLDTGVNLIKTDTDSIRDFNVGLRDLKNSDNKFVAIFKDQVKRMVNVEASYDELLTVRSLVESYTSNSEDERTKKVLEKFFPTNETVYNYGLKGINLDKLTKRHHKNTRTNMSVWDLLNSMTDVASHDYGMGVGPVAKSQLKKQSGLFMFKKEFDVEFLI